MFMVMLWWPSPFQEFPGSFGECRLSTRWLPTPRPSQLTGAVSLLVGCYQIHIAVTIYYYYYQLESWYSFHCTTEGRRLS